MFKYSEQSPSFLVWDITVFNGKKKNIPFRNPGDIAGNLDKDGRFSVAFRENGKQVRKYCHRIIWEIFNGEIPKGMVIDHIDGNPMNNNIDNLRLTTYCGNNRNRARDSRNSSGINGVSFTKTKDGYEYWTVSWVDKDGKRKLKHFSLLKSENAKQQAENFRNKVLSELNNSLEIQYSPRHGVQES